MVVVAVNGVTMLGEGLEFREFIGGGLHSGDDLIEVVAAFVIKGFAEAGEANVGGEGDVVADAILNDKGVADGVGDNDWGGGELCTIVV